MLSGFRFIAKTDISRFYHSIYTNSIPWAFHGKIDSKLDRKHNSPRVFFNRYDFIAQRGQDGQTVGLPVGPDFSRFVAEVVSTSIDRIYLNNSTNLDVSAIRYVDDIWIGAHTLSDAEMALSNYREAIREFELDINESKTRIFDGNFHFAEQWPSDIELRLRDILERGGSRKEQWYRAFFEWVFSEAISQNDDGIIRYAIRMLDRESLFIGDWLALNPFLKRCFIKFSHSIDYILQVVLWRNALFGDIDAEWVRILSRTLYAHASLGNDSEVCWIIYAMINLGYRIDDQLIEQIILKCGSVSICALLHASYRRLASQDVFDSVQRRIRDHDKPELSVDWPIVIEWYSLSLDLIYDSPQYDNDSIAYLIDSGVSIFDADRLTRTLSEHGDDEEIPSAIEHGGSIYDDPSEDEQEDSF